MQNQEENYLPSLICGTPFEGRQLAIKLSRKTIGAIQPDAELRKALREKYATDTGQLIASAQVVAIEFQTIAQANNYWRAKD
jgi:nucleoside diphosphate kinase